MVVAIDLGARFPIEFKGFPPHMSAIDSVLWRRFRGVQNLPFLGLYFDVAVGRGAPGDVALPAVVQDAWERLTRLRCDVVGEAVDHWTIIELRGAAGPGAIGSLVVYETLWAQDPPDQRPVELWLVTDQFAENLRDSLARFSIKLFLV